MTMRPFSGRIIRVLWLEAAVLCCLLPAQPAPESAAAAGGELASAAAAAARGEPGAAGRLASLAPRYPLIADFIAFWRAQALAAQRRHEEAAAALDPVWRTRFPSSIAARAALLGAESLLQAGRPGDALALLERNFPSPGAEPRPLLLLARAREQLNSLPQAAALYQQVWCLHPASAEAEEASKALAALAARASLPPPPDELRVERARRLARAGRLAQARTEWLALAASAATPAVRELAQVGAAETLFEERKTREALAALLALRPSDPETDARRLYFIVLCHRRLDDPAAMLSAVEQARQRAPSSDWTLQALIQAGNHFLVRNEYASYLPLFRACADQFPQAPAAAGCHWRVAWRAWLDHRDEAEPLLKEHVRRFPASDRAGAALYYLGRLSEEKGNSAEAQAYFSEIQSRFPNFYYAVLAASRPQPAADGAVAAVNDAQGCRLAIEAIQAEAAALQQEARDLASSASALRNEAEKEKRRLREQAREANEALLAAQEEHGRVMHGLATEARSLLERIAERRRRLEATQSEEKRRLEQEQAKHEADLRARQQALEREIADMNTAHTQRIAELRGEAAALEARLATRKKELDAALAKEREDLMRPLKEQERGLREGQARWSAYFQQQRCAKEAEIEAIRAELDRNRQEQQRELDLLDQKRDALRTELAEHAYALGVRQQSVQKLAEDVVRTIELVKATLPTAAEEEANLEFLKGVLTRRQPPPPPRAPVGEGDGRA